MPSCETSRKTASLKEQHIRKKGPWIWQLRLIWENKQGYTPLWQQKNYRYIHMTWKTQAKDKRRRDQSNKNRISRHRGGCGGEYIPPKDITIRPELEKAFMEEISRRKRISEKSPPMTIPLVKKPYTMLWRTGEIGFLL